MSRDIQARHVLALLALCDGALLLLGFTLRRLHVHAPGIPINLGAKLLTAAVALSVVDRLGWWRRVGFRAPSRWSRLWLGWLPLLYVALAFAPGFAHRTVSQVVGIGALTVAVGIDEEVWCRGLLLESLRHRGTTAAVLLSSLAFGLLHGINALSGQPVSSTLVQMTVASFFGLALAAVRVRTHSIWPSIAVHALWDFALILRSGDLGSTQGTTGGQAAVAIAVMAPLAIHGVILARRSRVPGPDGRMPRRTGDPIDPGPVLVARTPAPSGPDALGPWPPPPPDVEAAFRGW